MKWRTREIKVEEPRKFRYLGPHVSVAGSSSSITFRRDSSPTPVNMWREVSFDDASVQSIQRGYLTPSTNTFPLVTPAVINQLNIGGGA